MRTKLRIVLGGSLACMIGVGALIPGSATAAGTPHLEPVGTFNASVGTAAGAEIVAYDPTSKRVFTTNGAVSSQPRIDVTDISNPGSPVALPSILLATLGSDIQSVAVQNGVVAAALTPLGGTAARQLPGKVAFFRPDGSFIRAVTVGALPDSVTFTEDGRYVLSANEGEPSCTASTTPAAANNPEGSVSIITVATGTVRTADFRRFNSSGLRNYLIGSGVRLNWPGATTAQDLEPEYITTKGSTAWVTLQEANAIAVINIPTSYVQTIVPLGSKRHDLAGQGLDPSDQDSASNGKALAIVQRPVDGLYMPDGIASTRNGFLVTANEGDNREYDCFSDPLRVSEAATAGILDASVYSGAILGNGPNGIGRLNISRTDGDTNGDGKIDRLKAYGARSFSIWSPGVGLLYDSGDKLEQLFAQDPTLDDFFNTDGEASGTPASRWDTRSDNKGPEPESVVVGMVNGKDYAFLALERTGGVATIDLSNPYNPTIVDYANPRFETGANIALDRAPEGLKFIPAAQSPNGVPLLLVANEVSGNTRIFEVQS